MEAVGLLAGGIAHDFNNLLTVILGYSEWLLQQMPAEAPGRTDLDEIRKAGARAEMLTRQLLAFSRQQMLEWRVADFNDIVADVEKLLHRVIGADIELVTELDRHIDPVKVDVGQMEQVLMNLAINARDAMPGGGRLSIRTHQRLLTKPYRSSGVTVDPGRYLVVAISDTGTGMTPEVVKQIFDPFFTTKEAGRGTGLGLSTVYGIVKQSSGFIFVETSPGHGATFEVYLPSVDEPVQAAVKADAGRHAGAAGSETVLLVDDDAGIRDLLRRALKGGGYEVITAPDGVEALAAAESHEGTIDCLITDLVMPRMGGSELASRLAARRPELSVLYISGYTNRQEWRTDASQAGRAYLLKPFTPSVLMRKVRDLLDAAATARTPARPRPGE
jgi:CheY-like chemotaxis protein